MKNLVATLALACLFIATASVVVWAPPGVGFGVVVVGGAAWCRWLERHGETS